MIEKYFNIHKLVKIKIQTCNIQKYYDLLVYLRMFENDLVNNDINVDIIFSDYSKRPHFDNYYVITKYSKPIFFANNYLDSPYDQFCFNVIDRPIVIYYQEYCPLPLTLLIELILLNKEYSFIHAAAIKYNNKTYIFLAYPGIGKTTLVSSFLEYGAKLLGDDMVIINDKEALSFPIDFAIYPYHLDIFKIKDNKAIKKLKIINMLQKLYDSKIGKVTNLIIDRFLKIFGFSSIELKRIFELIRSSHARVPILNIYDIDSIANQGKICKIFYVCRQKKLSKIVLETINAPELAEICTQIMMHEWSQSLPILTIYSGFSSFSIFSLYSKIKNLFENIFNKHEIYKIKIPADIDNKSFKKLIFKFFEKEIL